jgi:hypothetical protein
MTQLIRKEAFEGLELCEGKLSCTVLRGLDGSNPVRLLDQPPGGAPIPGVCVLWRNDKQLSEGLRQ